jgi:hypothetical protein
MPHLAMQIRYDRKIPRITSGFVFLAFAGGEEQQKYRNKTTPFHALKIRQE